MCKKKGRFLSWESSFFTGKGVPRLRTREGGFPIFRNLNGRKVSHAHRGAVVTALAHRARQHSFSVDLKGRFVVTKIP